MKWWNASKLLIDKCRCSRCCCKDAWQVVSVHVSAVGCWFDSTTCCFICPIVPGCPGSDLEVAAVDSKAATALHHFSRAGRHDLVKVLLQDPRCPFDLVFLDYILCFDHFCLYRLVACGGSELWPDLVYIATCLRYVSSLRSHRGWLLLWGAGCYVGVLLSSGIRMQMAGLQLWVFVCEFLNPCMCASHYDTCYSIHQQNHCCHTVSWKGQTILSVKNKNGSRFRIPANPIQHIETITWICDMQSVLLRFHEYF